MSKVYHLSASGSAENQNYKNVIAKVFKACIAENAFSFDVTLRDEDSVLFKTEGDGKSFTARKDLFPTFFNASATVESENTKEEKSSDAKPLTEKEKKLFGKPYTNDAGTVYCIRDFVRATVGGYRYHRGDVGIVVSTDREDLEAPLLVYFTASEETYWVPCGDFEKVYWPWQMAYLQKTKCIIL